MSFDPRIARPMAEALGDLATFAATVPLRRARNGPLRPGWSARLEIFFEVLKRDGARMMTLEPKLARAFRDASAILAVGGGVRFEAGRVGGVRCEWVVPASGGSRGVLVYLHGGAYVFGSPKTVRMVTASIAREADVRVASLDYRLAPEHRVSEAVDDVIAAIGALVKEHGGERVVLAGDSAGGGLTLLSLIALREAKRPMPIAAALLSPWCDLSGSTPIGPRAFDWAGPGFGEHFAKMACHALDPRDPSLSPLYAPLHDLPRTLVQLGGAEILYEEVMATVKRMKDAGVEVTLDLIDEGYHAMQYLDAPEAKAARSHVAGFVRGAIPR